MGLLPGNRWVEMYLHSKWQGLSATRAQGASMQAALVIIFIGAAGDFAFQVTVGPTNVQSMAQYMVFLKDSFGRWNQAAAVGVSLMGLALFGSLLLALASRLLLRGGRW